MLIGPVIMELRCEEAEKSSLENSKIGVTKKIMDLSKLDCSTSSYQKFSNTGPIDMFFPLKCNYFSWATRWNHSFLSKPPLKGCFGTLKLSGHVLCPVLYIRKEATKSSTILLYNQINLHLCLTFYVHPWYSWIKKINNLP